MMAYSLRSLLPLCASRGGFAGHAAYRYGQSLAGSSKQAVLFHDCSFISVTVHRHDANEYDSSLG